MIKIHNTQSGKVEEFEPLDQGKVSVYVCGPTVYDIAHLGHGRSAVSFDVIRRYFIYRGYEVNFVSNYTDVDDKMIKRANDEGITVEDLTNKILPEYEKDYGLLGVMAPDVQPKATEHVEVMVDLVKRLEDGNYTYVLDDGVYFDVTKFESYGKLSKQRLEDLKMGARVEVKESKRNPYDFALWKFKKEGEPFWPSPWGDGRPGWHIECSAMSWKHLGESFDIHGGGLDLTFPHHECEIAQSQGAFGEDKFARYWIHNGFINVGGEKMSKSLGNFSTLKDIFENYSPQVVRFMFLQTHYRNPIDFSPVLLDQAKAAIGRFHDFVRNMRNLMDIVGPGEVSTEVMDFVDLAKTGFESSMDADFDTSGALGSVFELVKEVNILVSNDRVNKADLEIVLKFLESADKVLGVIFYEEEIIDAQVKDMIKKREEARVNKDFTKADRIRDYLLKKGIVLEDKPERTVWKKS